MSYDLMLLADPGTDRAEVLRVLTDAPDIRPDPALDNRFWLTTPHGEAQINIGTKDPVESVHVEFEMDSTPLMEAAATRALELADALSMRMEDVQWGEEVTPADLPRLREHWAGMRRPHIGAESAGGAKRAWWRFW